MLDSNEITMKDQFGNQVNMNNLVFSALHKNWRFLKSSHPEVFFRKGVLKIYSKFTGEDLCQSVISESRKSHFGMGVSPLNLLHIFRTPFPRNTSRWLLLVFLTYSSLGRSRTLSNIYDGKFLQKNLHQRCLAGSKVHLCFYMNKYVVIFYIFAEVWNKVLPLIGIICFTFWTIIFSSKIWKMFQKQEYGTW